MGLNSRSPWYCYGSNRFTRLGHANKLIADKFVCLNWVSNLSFTVSSALTDDQSVDIGFPPENESKGKVKRESSDEGKQTRPDNQAR
jgi:hypothetical protein